MTLHVLVLAGGSGTRLWPLSRAGVPKHLLPLAPGGRTLLRATVERVLPLGGPVHVVTVSAQAEMCRAALEGLELGPDPVIAEPAPRGTGPALGLATRWIARNDPDALVCSVHADAHVADEAAYRVALWAAAGWARATGGLAAVGLQPRSPSTGLGYVALGEPRTPGEWVSPGGVPGPLNAGAAALDAYAGAGFTEKPAAAVAEAYLRGGRHLWNLGLFAWPAATFERELHAADPGLGATLDQVVESRAGGDEDAATSAYSALGGVAVEPLVFERTRRLTVVRATFPWSDLGSWSDLREVRAAAGQADADGNVIHGDGITVGARDCLVASMGGRLVAAVGVEGIVVVDTGDAVLVVAAEHAQRVRDAVEVLKAQGREDLL